MPLPVFAKKDEIPKGFEDLYEEKDGKFVPKGEDDSELKRALQKERERADAAEKLTKKAADDRADLERKLAAASSGDEKDKVSKALKKFDEDLAAEKEKFQKELEKRDAELRTLKLDDKAKAAFLKAGGRPERADAALKLYGDKLDLASDGRIVVKDEKGQITSTTIDDFWGKTVRGEMADFYTGTKAAGGGGTGGASPSPTTGGQWDAEAVLKDPLGALNAANTAGTKAA